MKLGSKSSSGKGRDLEEEMGGCFDQNNICMHEFCNKTLTNENKFHSQ